MTEEVGYRGAPVSCISTRKIKLNINDQKEKKDIFTNIFFIFASSFSRKKQKSLTFFVSQAMCQQVTPLNKMVTVACIMINLVYLSSVVAMLRGPG